MNKVQKAVQQELELWKEDVGTPSDPYEIANGMCRIFAHDVVDRLNDPQIVVWSNSKAMAEVEDERLMFSPGHWWIVDTRNMIHYDAEAREGVDFWYELPIFARTLES